MIVTLAIVAALASAGVAAVVLWKVRQTPSISGVDAFWIIHGTELRLEPYFHERLDDR